MSKRKRRVKPSSRCVHCGTQVTADDMAEVHRKYTEHVVKEHGKPSKVAHTDQAPTTIQNNE